MTREELIKKVALKMDEISSSNESIVVVVNSGDNNPLYAQINNLLNECVNDVLMKAPIYRLQSLVSTIDESTTEEIFNGARKIVIFSVPDNFLRLVSISDASFQRPIVDLSIEGDATDKRQHNRHLVAKNAKPVAVIGHNDTNRVIKCYSYEASETPAPTFIYVPRYDKDTALSSEIGLNEYIIDVVSWVCAGRVFAAQGDINRGKLCDENAAALMI